MAAAPSFETVTSDDALKQGVISAALGGSAMVARQLLSTDKPSWGYLVRSGVAACVTAYFVNFASKDYVQSENLRVCICGIAGFASPEILSYGLAFLKAKMQGKVEEAQRGLNKTSKQPKKKKKAK
jgi:hypothetical protein